MNNKYTFDDWLSYKIYRETCLDGHSCGNDSEKYLSLVGKGMMTYDVLNEIQKQQQLAYEFMVNYGVAYTDSRFIRDTSDSLDVRQVLEHRISTLELGFQQRKGLYQTVLKPQKHRGIKIGAKFITPDQWKAYKDNKVSDPYLFISSRYQQIIDGQLVSFPTSEQMLFAQMEANILWHKKLLDYRKELSALDKNLIDLQQSNEFYEQRIRMYFDRTKIATNFVMTEKFIETELADFQVSTKNPPIKIIPKGPHGEDIEIFNHSEYAIKVFNYLSRGYNYPVKNLISSARTECKNVNESHLRKYGRMLAGVQTNLTFDLLIISYIKKGVAFIMYQKFLKDELARFSSIKTVDKGNNGEQVDEISKHTQSQNVEVFVTYCWEKDPGHQNTVFAFTNHLRENGFEATMDLEKSQKEASISFPSMMHYGIQNAKKVIVVLSEGYKIKAESNTGGVGIEYQIILANISRFPNKYILVSLDDFSEKIIPHGFYGREILNVRKRKDLNSLYAKLQDKHKYQFSPVSAEKPHITSEQAYTFRIIEEDEK